MREWYDLLIVGGGINGVGIARDAAGRGLKVCLCECEDLAAHTSSASTKLIHGGLRYLEQFDFALVRKALAEREVLLKAAPHIVHPLRFVLPHEKHLRPAWLIGLGLVFYDHMGRGQRSLPPSRRIDFRRHAAGQALREGFATGFEYSDARTDDARLVVLNAIDARERGATIRARTRCVDARRTSEGWDVQLEPASGGATRVGAAALVNATGPWAVRFLDEVARVGHTHALRLVKGSHIVVARLFEHDEAYIFQQPDRRIVFAIPYQHDFTLIGTTDIDYRADPAVLHIDDTESRYLCRAVNHYFRRQITPSDVVWRYSGVRPLLAYREHSAQAVTRDYLIELDTRGAPLVSVFGGKLTTYRRLAEEALDRLAPLLPGTSAAWTAKGHPLPGGDCADIGTCQRQLQSAYPWLPEGLARRLVRSYGTRSGQILGAARSLAELGGQFGADLYRAEVDYLRDREWAVTAEDILWRRSKLGLRVNDDDARRLAEYLAAPRPGS
jgi:glycerol-3-phosphate dehydrogenase